MPELESEPETDPNAEINRLVAIQRNRLDADFIDDYDKFDDDGNKIKEIEMPKQDGQSRTRDVNMTHLYQPCVSRTDDVEILRIEAELAAEGRVAENPHIPRSAETMKLAKEAIDADDNIPAWRLVGNV